MPCTDDTGHTDGKTVFSLFVGLASGKPVERIGDCCAIPAELERNAGFLRQQKMRTKFWERLWIQDIYAPATGSLILQKI
jgi:hypothetical protein